MQRVARVCQRQLILVICYMYVGITFNTGRETLVEDLMYNQKIRTDITDTIV